MILGMAALLLAEIAIAIEDIECLQSGHRELARLQIENDRRDGEALPWELLHQV